MIVVSYPTWEALASQGYPICHRTNQDGNYNVWTGHADLLLESLASGADKTAFDAAYLSESAVVLGREEAEVICRDLIATGPTPKNTKGNVKVQVEVREGSKLEIFSQNFCDQRTWFTTSTRVTGESMTDSGDGLTFNLSAGPKVLVDVTHGRLSEEHKLLATYITNVYVDGVLQTQHSPDDCLSFDGTGAEVHNYGPGQGDYGIDYLTGDVTFKTSKAGQAVTIDYSEVVNSKWYIKPDAGKRIELISAELQFSRKARMKSAFLFQPRGDVGKHPLLAVVLDDASNPAKTALAATYTWNGTTTLTASNTSEVAVGLWISLDGSGLWFEIESIVADTSVTVKNPLGLPIPSGTTPSAKSPMALYPSGTSLPLGEPTRYVTKFDIVAEANGSYPIIPADIQLPGGGWSWRQSPEDIEIFRWDYGAQAALEIKDTWGMDVEVCLEDDVPAEGWRAVVTLYGLSEDDT